MATKTTARILDLLQEGENRITVEALGNDIATSNRSTSEYVTVQYGELEYELVNNTYYQVVGMGQSDPYYAKVKPEYEGKPVTAIANDAFSGVLTLMKVNIPSSVTRIGSGAFSGCVNLEIVENEDSMIEEIGTNAFKNCEKLKTFTFNEKLKYIHDYAFYQCYELAHEFSASVTKTKAAFIGNYAFYQTGLHGPFLLPNCCEAIGKYAFAYTNVTSFYMDAKGRLEPLCDHAFYKCKELKYVSFNNYVYAIESSTFAECSSLEGVNIPASCNYILPYAFANCEKLGTASGYDFANKTGWIMTSDMGDTSSSSVVYLNAGLRNENIWGYLSRSFKDKYFVKLNKIPTPNIYLNGPNLEITDRSGWATQYNIWVNDSIKATVDAEAPLTRIIRANTAIFCNQAIEPFEGTIMMRLKIQTPNNGISLTEFICLTCYGEKMYYITADGTLYDAYDFTKDEWLHNLGGETLIVMEDAEITEDFYDWLKANTSYS